MFLQLPGIDKYLPKLQAVLFDLSAISEEDLPTDPDAPELGLVLAALKVVFSKEITEKITDIKVRLNYDCNSDSNICRVCPDCCKTVTLDWNNNCKREKADDSAAKSASAI